jgi:monoamine oxidase
MGFQTRLWRTQGYAGDCYVDLPFMSGWDASRGQDGTQGVYTIYPGGKAARDLAAFTKFDQADRLLPELARIFPGIKKQWLKTALRAYWPANPWVKASYAAYLPGQWTGIRGAEGFPVDNLYFAGEHTSLDWQGYMNGGAESGRLVAEEIIGVGAEASKRAPRRTPALA